MRTIVVTGSASGIGAATVARLEAQGDNVIGVDLHDADVIADLSSDEERRSAIAAVGERSEGHLDGLVTCAGLGGKPDRPGSVVVEVNYFGTVDFLAGLQPLLAEADTPSAVAISSNSTTCQPGVPRDVIEACLANDLAGATAAGDEAGSLNAYAATKIALSWWVRRNAPTEAWAGAGIRLNAVAPGMIETALVAEQRADPTVGPLLDMFPLPLGRAGRAEEIAALVAFLLGPDARFFCGSVVFCDGGTDALLRADDWPAPWDLDMAAAPDVFG